jgi:hypothetical protein
MSPLSTSEPADQSSQDLVCKLHISVVCKRLTFVKTDEHNAKLRLYRTDMDQNQMYTTTFGVNLPHHTSL